jgi:hypothetical protein
MDQQFVDGVIGGIRILELPPAERTPRNIVHGDIPPE